MTTRFSLKNVQARGAITYPDINIEAGSITFISGESGCGKSTLLNLLNGMLDDYTGAINYNQKDLRSYDPLQLRREVLLISQSVYLFEATVEENFAMFHGYRNLPPPKDTTIQYYLNLCSISIPLNMPASKLSGGEQHRVYMAIFISFGASVLLLDEPTSALDCNNAEALLENICQYCHQSNTTLIVVSHDLCLASKFAENCISLEGTHE